MALSGHILSQLNARCFVCFVTRSANNISGHVHILNINSSLNFELREQRSC